MKTDTHGYIDYDNKVWFIKDDPSDKSYKAQTNGVACSQDIFQGIPFVICEDSTHKFFNQDWWYGLCYREDGFCQNVGQEEFEELEKFIESSGLILPEFKGDMSNWNSYLEHVSSDEYKEINDQLWELELQYFRSLPGWMTWDNFVPEFEKVLNEYNTNNRLSNFKIEDFCYESKVIVTVELDGKTVRGVVTWQNCD